MSEIIHVISVNDFACINGGQAKVAVDEAKGLIAAGLNVTFFAPTGPIDPGLAASGATVICLEQPDILSDPSRLRAMRRGIWNRDAARALRDLLAQHDPATTVVHCHGFAKALSPAIAPVLTKTTHRVVYTMHEFFLACPNGGFYDYQKNEICTRRALSLDCLKTNCDVRHPAHKAWRVARQAALWGAGGWPKNLTDVICISEVQKRAMAPYLSDRTKVHDLPNPVGDGKPPRTATEANDTWLFVGRLNPEKGAVLFAEAARRAGVKAVFVGDGAEREAVMAANPDAQITGWVAPEEVTDWLAKARALVFPSLWYETFGLVAFEALARGVPVVTGQWTAAADGVTDGVTGALAEAPTPEAFASAIARAGQLNGPAVYDAHWQGPLAPRLTLEAHTRELRAIYAGL